MFQKLSLKWLGLYQICDALKDKDTYILEKLNRSQLAGTFVSDKLKKFHVRQQLQLDHAPNLNHEEILTFDNFLIGDSDSDFSDMPNSLFAI